MMSSEIYTLKFHGISLPLDQRSGNGRYGCGCGYVLLNEVGEKIDSTGTYLDPKASPIMAAFHGLIEGLQSPKLQGKRGHIQMYIEGHSEEAILQVSCPIKSIIIKTNSTFTKTVYII
jgi:hypothetical protein